MKSGGPPVSDLKTSAYRIPADSRGADGTFSGNVTTAIRIRISADEQEGFGNTYADPSIAALAYGLPKTPSKGATMSIAQHGPLAQLHTDAGDGYHHKCVLHDIISSYRAHPAWRIVHGLNAGIMSGIRPTIQIYRTETDAASISTKGDHTAFKRRIYLLPSP